MADMIPQAQSAAPVGAGHEPSEVGIKRIFFFGGGLVIVTAVVMLVLGAVMGRFMAEKTRLDRDKPAFYEDETGQYPSPRLQRSDIDDMNRLRDADRAALNNYGWVNQMEGIARIPIDRAIAILADRGLPAKKALAKPASPEPKKN